MAEQPTREWYEKELAARDKTLAVLISAAERTQRNRGSALSLLHENAALEHTVQARTRELEEERAELEKTLRAHREIQTELLHAQKLSAIGELAGGIAHEINTPMQFIHDNVHFLGESFGELLDIIQALGPQGLQPGSGRDQAENLGYLREEIPRAIEQTNEGIQRVISIVRAMKEFSHPSRGRKERSDLHACLESTVTVARNVWKYVADVQRDYDLTCPQVPLLRDEFNQVILNLVVNAADAISDATGKGENGKGVITLRTRSQGDTVLIQVEDTGTGIPEGIRAKVFEPFFTTKGVGKGSGQGLAIAYSTIVTKHGGQIGFECGPAGGTRFWIRLPSGDPAVDPPPAS